MIRGRSPAAALFGLHAPQHRPGPSLVRPYKSVFWCGLTAFLTLMISSATGQDKGISPASHAPLKTSNSTAGEIATPDDHYLMLVAGTRAFTLTPTQLTVFKQSPYDGLAVRFLTQYDTAPMPPAQEMGSKLLELKKSTSKDYWPWVFLNRMVGRDPELDTPYGRDPYFTRIHGIDLEDVAGAQRNFLQDWQNSLRAANQAHAPGIVVDLELYVNYKAYEPALLAQQVGKSVEQTIELLHKLGMRLADAAAKEYPNGVIWFLFTDLGQYGWKVEGNVKYYPTPAYIVLGFLDEIREKKYALKAISGGEVGLEYCSFSLEHLKRKIDGRARDFAPHLQNYGGALELGGTMILWPDRASKTDFMAVGPCGKSDANTVEDQQAYLELLFKAYRYNWIYGTHNSGYDPFNALTAPRFNAVVRKAEANAESVSLK
jgi:hypothetical protein